MLDEPAQWVNNANHSRLEPRQRIMRATAAPRASRMLFRLLSSRYFLWFALSVPAAWMVTGYASGRLYYGEVVHASGEWSVRLIMLALAATPLLLMFPGRAVPRWLMRQRRAFGVAAFGYALLHTLIYAGRTDGFAEVVAEAVEGPYLTG